MNDLDATVAALADPTRRKVVDLLRKAPRRAGEPFVEGQPSIEFYEDA